MSVAAEAKQAAQSPWVARLGRIGLVAKGVSYGLVGVLAILVALDAGGKTTDRQGALRTVGQHGLGRLLLVALAVGFAAYAAWRFAQGFLDRDREGTEPKGLAKRAADVAKGLVYGALFLSTLSILLGEGGGSSNKEDKTTGGILGWPGGRWVVIAIGVAIAGAGAWNGYRALTATFRKKLHTGEMADAPETLAVVLGVVGHAARAVVFLIAGWFLVQAAWDYDPQEAVGLDGALQKLSQQPYGEWLLGGVAAGLIAYGLYCLFEARYRKM
jgi:uncharacterized membrane protein YidH (DUF202 family)